MKIKPAIRVFVAILAMTIVPQFARAQNDIVDSMREFQARYYVVTGGYVPWLDCKCGTPAPHMPDSTFYGDLSNDKVMSLQLVQNLTFWFYNAKCADSDLLISKYIKTNALEGTTGPTFYQPSDFPCPDEITLANYPDWFLTLKSNIKQLQYVAAYCYAGNVDTNNGCDYRYVDVSDPACTNAATDASDPRYGAWERSDNEARSGEDYLGIATWDTESSDGTFEAKSDTVRATLVFSPTIYPGFTTGAAEIFLKIITRSGGLGANSPPRLADGLCHSYYSSGATQGVDIITPPIANTIATVTCGDDGAGWDATPGSIPQWCVLTPVFKTSADKNIVCGGGCATCGGDGNSCGSTSAKTGCLSLQISLGPEGDGTSAGYFYLEGDAPSAALFASQSINYAVKSDVGVNLKPTIIGGVGCNVITTPTVMAYWPQGATSGYTINFSTVFDPGSEQPNIIASVTIAEADNSTNHMTVTENIGANSRTLDFVYTQPNGPWTLTEGSRNEVRYTSWTTNVITTRTDSVTVTDGNGHVATQIQEVYQLFSAGLQMIGQTFGTGPAAKTTTWNYFQTGQNYGLLQEVVDPYGHWKEYQYDASGRTTDIIEGFGNNAIDGNTSADANRHTVITYNDAAGQTTTIQYLLGQEIGRTYQIDSVDGNIAETQNITCTQAGKSVGDPSNLTNIVWRAIGPVGATRAWDTLMTSNADGTMSFYAYGWANGGGRVVIVDTGAPDPNDNYTSIADGTETTTTTGLWNQLISSEVTDIASDYTRLSLDTYTYSDPLYRSYTVTHLDDTTESAIYGCCGVSSTTDRDGTETDYFYDGAKRQIATLRLGIAQSNVLDADGRVLESYRVGTDQIPVQLNAMTYDNAGTLIGEVNALGGVTSHTGIVDGSGQMVYTDTHPDLGTVITTKYIDGTLASIGGTAGHATSYTYGADSTGAYTIESKLDSHDGASEWFQSYVDVAGRPLMTVYPGSPANAVSYSYYNSQGQLSNTLDPDGVRTIYQNNTKGERLFQALDEDGDGGITFVGTDRITATYNDVVPDPNNGILRRTRVFAWTTPGVDSSSQVSETDTSADGLNFWQTRYYATGSSVTRHTSIAYNGITRTVTATAEDGTSVVTIYTNGVRQSITQKNNTGGTIGGTTYTYDPQGRVATATDARNNNVTGYAYNNADQVAMVTTPPPLPGLSGLTTTTYYDASLRATSVTYPDSSSATTLYTPDGQVQQTSGSRTYPVAYTYDTQGRMKTMTTWTNFGSGTGAAVTTWNYDPNRGWLTSKLDATNQGSSYAYTPAGRLYTRTWARGISTYYMHNNSGDLTSVHYMDAVTPAFTNSYDRMGRLSAVDCDNMLTTLAYDLAGDLLCETNAAIGRMFHNNAGMNVNGLWITNIYDNLLQRTSLTVNYGTATLAQTTYTYDTAGRMSVVSDGADTATYNYLANTRLVDHIVFANTATRMTTQNGFDYVNRRTGVTNFNGSGTVLDSHGYGYNAASQRTSMTNTDGAYWAYQYDALGQVTNGIKKWANNAVVPGQQFGYGFDDIGNRKMTLAGGDQFGLNRRLAGYTANSVNEYTRRVVPAQTDVLGKVANTATVWVDKLPAVQSNGYFWLAAPVTNTSSPAYQTLTTLAAVPNGTSAEYGVTNVGHVFVPQTPENFVYDLDGNLTQDGRWSYGWDAENRLLSMTSLSGAPSASKLQLNFAYDYKGRRIEKQVATYNGSGYATAYANQYIYDGWNLEAIVNSGALLNSFVWGLDSSGSMQGAGGVGGLLMQNIVGNGVHFAAQDANGNVSALVSAANGTVTATYEYGPFGEIIRATGPMAKLNPFRFSTKFTDDESGLLYYGYRFYNPFTGRWLSRDPIEELGGKNLYTFVCNTPMFKIDKLGLFSFFCDKCILGNIRHVHIRDWGLIPVSSQGNPNTVAAAMDALGGTDVASLVSDIGGIAGLSDGELLKNIASIANSLADSGIGAGMTSGWTEAMVNAISQIQRNLGNREGVYIDAQVAWQKCEHIETWSWGGGLPLTGRLDWVDHSRWYINENAGTSGPSGAGFAYADSNGIMNALTASFIAALENTSY
jgi:RHS repeat-associated protein